jgi:threonine dehydrogenase-like Zn-dependent dehydrogenase
MRANCWYGKNDVRVETVPDPKILNETDAIIRITSRGRAVRREVAGGI